MKHFSFVVFFQIVLNSCLGNINFIENSSSDYSVVVQNTSQAILKPANFFRYYVKKASGFNLPITNNGNNIQQISFSLDNKMAVGAFDITIDKRNIKLIGGNEHGLLSAATYLLENYFQIAFLSAEVVTVPFLKQVILPEPFSISKSPDFKMRMIHSLEGYSEDYTQTHSLNIPFLKYSLFPNSFNEDFLPVKNYFSLHPDYYITVDGKTDTSQPNLLQPVVQQIVANKVLERSKNVSESISYYNIFLNDNPKTANSGSAAKFLENNGYTFSDVYFDFVNKIAYSFPKLNFLALAYEQTKNVPNKVLPAKNVSVVLTNADNNKSKSIVVDDFDAQQRLHMKTLIKNWLQIDSSLIYWDYLTNYSNPIMPWPNLYTIKPNITYYRNAGLKNIFFQLGGFYPSEASELKGYLCSKLMFDVKCNEDSLISKFCMEFYGSAGRSMYDYFSEINSKAFKSNIIMYTYDSPLKFSETLFSYNNVVKWQQMLQVAEKSVGADSIKKRIKKEKLGLDYVYLELSIRKTGWNNRDNKKNLLEKISKFENETSEVKFSYISSSFPNIRTYIDNLRKQLL